MPFGRVNKFVTRKQEFQDLRTTLQQQQEDVTTSLKNLGVSSISKHHTVPPYSLTAVEENYKSWQLQDVSVDDNETQKIICISYDGK